MQPYFGFIDPPSNTTDRLFILDLLSGLVNRKFA